jgi:transposase-like protein
MQQESRPRQRFTPSERARLLAAYRRSDLTQREFASRHELSVACLSAWLRKFKSTKVDDVPSAFMEMPGGLPRAEISRAAYKIQFPGGLNLEVSEGFRLEELTQLCQMVRGL